MARVRMCYTAARSCWRCHRPRDRFYIGSLHEGRGTCIAAEDDQVSIGQTAGVSPAGRGESGECERDGFTPGVLFHV